MCLISQSTHTVTPASLTNCYDSSNEGFEHIFTFTVTTYIFINFMNMNNYL